MSEIVLDAAAGVAEAGMRVFDFPSTILEGMMENVTELHEFGQQTKESIRQSLKKAGETIEQGVENIKKLPMGKQ